VPEAEQVGASVPPVDVGTTGNRPSYEPQPTTTAPSSFLQNPIVQVEGGVLEGVFLGCFPFGAVAEQVLTGTGALPRGTVAFERGLALGQMAAGLAEMAAGAGGGALAGLMSATGIGAPLGIPAIVVSAVVVTGGAANVAAGLVGLMSTGSGAGSGSQSQPPATKAQVTPGRSRSQQRLRQIAADPNTSAADRGWIQQEMNSIERGQRSNIRNPPGKQLAHALGREAAKGYDHVESPSNLQDTDLHQSQHKLDDFGRANNERP